MPMVLLHLSYADILLMLKAKSAQIFLLSLFFGDRLFGVKLVKQST